MTCRRGPRAQQPELRTATTCVLFDVVVRDYKGRPIEGLSLSDFELREDGTRQHLTAGIARRGSAGLLPFSPPNDTAPPAPQ